MITRFSDEAAAGVEETACWYDSRRSGLGMHFLDEFHRVLAIVGERPLSYQRLADTAVDLQIRRTLLARFPYAIVFMVLQDQVRILAVCHQRREPGYWLYRTSEES